MEDKKEYITPKFELITLVSESSILIDSRDGDFEVPVEEEGVW